MQELDKVAFPTVSLPDALQAELLLDLTDQPPADTITAYCIGGCGTEVPAGMPRLCKNCDATTRRLMQDVVTPSTNGTS